MLREFWQSLSDMEKAEFSNKTGVKPGMLKKYLSPSPTARPKPSQSRFNRILSQANEMRPACFTRDQLAAYFYAASGRTGTGKPEAA